MLYSEYNQNYNWNYSNNVYSQLKIHLNPMNKVGFSILWLRKRLVYEFKGTLHEIWSGTYVIFCTLRLRFNICSTPNFVQGPFNMILWLRKILFITRNIWGNKCMTYFKGPCTKFEVELMSFFIHFGWFNICSTSNFVQSPFKWLQFINAIYTSIYLFNIQNM